MKRVVDVLYGLKGFPNAARFAEFKADLFSSGFTENAVISIPSTTARAISIGTKGTTYANSTALPITSIGGTLDAEPAKNYLVGVFSKVSTSESTTSTDDLGSIWARTRVDTGKTIGAGYSLYGIRSQLRIYATAGGATNISNWAAAGLLGILEVSGATTTFASGCVAAAGYFNVALTTTSVIASGAVVAGVVINSGSAAITNTGSAYYGLYIQDYATGNVDFNAGVKIANSCCTTGIDIGTVTTAISIGTAATGISMTGTITNALDFTAVTNVTNFIKFNAMAGCVLSVDVNPKETPSGGGLGADGCIRIVIGAADYFIPIFAVEVSHSA